MEKEHSSQQMSTRTIGGWEFDESIFTVSVWGPWLLPKRKAVHWRHPDTISIYKVTRVSVTYIGANWTLGPPDVTHENTMSLPWHPPRNAGPESNQERTSRTPKLGDTLPKHWPVHFNTSTQRNSWTWHLIQTEGDHRNIQLSAMRDHGLDPGQMATAEHELWIRGIDVHFPDFDQCRMILRENFLVFKKSALKYLGVKGHTVSNLLSNGSEKYISIRICVCVCAWVCKENMIKQMH